MFEKRKPESILYGDFRGAQANKGFGGMGEGRVWSLKGLQDTTWLMPLGFLSTFIHS